MTKAEEDQLDRQAVRYGLPVVLVVLGGLVWFFRQQVGAELAVLGVRWGVAAAVLACGLAAGEAWVV